MKKYFWREKNADKFIKEYEVINPTKQEIYDEIIKKFYEKLDMINVIFNYKKRNEYLLKKNKVIPEHTPEILIQQKIGTRVIVDFLQLIKDFCDLENINIKSDFAVCNKDKDSICKSLKSAIDNLKIETQNNLQIIFDNVLCLIDLLKLKYEDMEKERIVVENNEGSFRNGKFVIK